MHGNFRAVCISLPPLGQQAVETPVSFLLSGLSLPSLSLEWFDNQVSVARPEYFKLDSASTSGYSLNPLTAFCLLDNFGLHWIKFSNWLLQACCDLRVDAVNQIVNTRLSLNCWSSLSYRIRPDFLSCLCLLFFFSESLFRLRILVLKSISLIQFLPSFCFSLQDLFPDCLPNRDASKLSEYFYSTSRQLGQSYS